MADSNATVADLKRTIEAFVKEREWERFHEPKNLSMAVAVEAAELMELLLWVSSEEASQLTGEPETRKQIEEELADVMIYCFSLANHLGVDVSEAIARKVKANAEKYPARDYKGRYRRG